MTLASLLPWKRVKPADPMQEVQSDPTPTLAEMEKVASAMRRERDHWKRLALGGDAARIKAVSERVAAYTTLCNIAAQETENANATVKRMARMAREALPEYADGAVAADREAA